MNVPGGQSSVTCDPIVALKVPPADTRYGELSAGLLEQVDDTSTV